MQNLQSLTVVLQRSGRWMFNGRRSVGEKAKESAAVMMLDVNKNVAATAAGSLAWASPAQADAYGGHDRVLLGRRTPDALPPSFLNPRYTKVAADQYCFATHACSESNSTSLPSAVRGFVGLREFVGSGTNVAEAAMADKLAICCFGTRGRSFVDRVAPQPCSPRPDGGGSALCNAPLFPRTDPVIIVVVLSPDGERVLIGRQRAWPQGGIRASPALLTRERLWRRPCAGK